MKVKLFFLTIFIVLFTNLFAQLNISTNLREDYIWDDVISEWEIISTDDQELTFFVFEEVNPKDMRMFKHTTPTMTSAYIINRYTYDEENDWDEYEIVSDVGNKYFMVIDVNNSNIRFISIREDGMFLVRHTIKQLWIDEETLESNERPENVEENKDWDGNGTGFFIDVNGYLATNYHVIEGATYIEIEYIRDGKIQKNKVNVVNSDQVNDLSVLKINDNDFRPFSSIPYNFSNNVVDVGTSVFALGYPMALDIMGKEIKFTDGKISSKTGIKGDIVTYQMTTPIQPGNSGGPLFDYDGNLVGINALILKPDIADNVSYAIKSSYLKSLIDVLPAKLMLPADTNINEKILTEKVKIISDYVVLIKVR